MNKIVISNLLILLNLVFLSCTQNCNCDKDKKEHFALVLNHEPSNGFFTEVNTPLFKDELPDTSSTKAEEVVCRSLGNWYLIKDEKYLDWKLLTKENPKQKGRFYYIKIDDVTLAEAETFISFCDELCNKNVIVRKIERVAPFQFEFYFFTHDGYKSNQVLEFKDGKRSLISGRKDLY